MQDLLSQDEIDALLHGVDDGDVETESDIGTEGVKTYDLTNQQRIVRGRLPILDTINERFARFMRLSMQDLLRRPCDASVGGLQVSKFTDYIHGLSLPTSLNIAKFNPLKGNGIFVLDGKLVFKLVDNYFGGDGRSTKIEDREFTPVEQRIMQMVLGTAFADMSKAWEDVHPLQFELVSSETNPALLANFVAPNDMVVVNTFHIELDGGGGDFQVVFPYALVEPIKEQLLAVNTAAPSTTDVRWRDALRQGILDASVDFGCNLFEQEISLRDVVDLEPGDIIPVEMQDQIVLKANGIPMFRTKVGVTGGSLALKIEKVLDNLP